MLGKSVAVCAALLLSCAHNVSQDKATGADGKNKGAKTIEFENGEARATGIVTYPGGDRVDWKLIELPEKKSGSLDFKLTWTPPRPGLQLAFDVLDEWNHSVFKSKRTSKRRAGRTRVKRGHISDAKGKYYVRVYAVGRGDAGKYRLTIEFAESTGTMFDPLTLDIQGPPKLAAVPEPEVPCDPFDAKLPSCKNVCPDFGAPPGWKPCEGRCPTPPDINLPSCQATMPCPNPPDRRVKDCLRHPEQHWPKCDLKNPDPQNPRCDNATADPVTARVMKSDFQGGETIITIGAGKASGVAKGWRVYVLRGDTDSPLPGGEVSVVRIDNNFTVGKVRLTVDQLKANDRVKLTPK
jgi:hypothetical protein